MTKRPSKEERKLYNIFSASKAEYKNPSLKGKRFDTTFRKVYNFYLKNKERIDNVKVDYPARQFIRSVFEGMNHKTKKNYLTAEQASKMIIRQQAYLSKAERARENLMSSLLERHKAEVKKRKEGGEPIETEYEQWRKFTRHQKIDWSKFVYVGDKTYQYSTKNWNIYIKIENSPETIKVWKEKV